MPTTQSTNTGQNAAAGRRPSRFSLRARVVINFLVGSAAAIAILFLPAGTVRFWQGWVYLAIMLVPTFSAYLYFLKHDPELLQRRLQQGEQVREQKLLLRWLKPFFFAVFLLPGLDHRLGWSSRLWGGVPLWLTLVAQAVSLAAMVSAVLVIGGNRFAARTIQVEAGQTVVSTGPYRIVRHPMYSATIVLWLFTPFALSSWVSWPFFALLNFFYVFRLLNEEKVLRAELPGYSDYCLRTRYRLIPFVW